VNHILGICTANERGWMFVDLPIPKLTNLIIGYVPGEDKVTSEE